MILDTGTKSGSFPNISGIPAIFHSNKKITFTTWKQHELPYLWFFVFALCMYVLSVFSIGVGEGEKDERAA